MRCARYAAQVHTGGWQLADFFASHSSIDGGDDLTVTVDPPVSHRWSS